MKIGSIFPTFLQKTQKSNKWKKLRNSLKLGIAFIVV